MNRTNKVNLIAGGRGTGKTDYTKQVIQASIMPKKLIVDTFDNPPWRNFKTWNHPEWERLKIPLIPDIKYLKNWKQGTYRIVVKDFEEFNQFIEEHVFNALILYEDATRFIGSTLDPNLKSFIYDTKQKNIDMLFVFHSLASIPPELVRSSDTLTLFKTNEGHPDKKKYPWPDIPIVMDGLRESTNRFLNFTIHLS
ncbi:hypothetical protein [Lishizhenia sp.]|uniref:hypothetical protein n=1 Tax=Lishizhenia sp. TaxID=2497594 RepID=UPI00299ECABC|nr:hypothetical protein [Lishizhenia sp.]MDX1447218.1 hypothetical protein [Lishizhenia sp.]